jgi:hypothetical protein
MKDMCCDELAACLNDETCTCSLKCTETGVDPAHCVVQCGGAWGTSRLAHLIGCTWKNDCACPHWSDAGQKLGQGD